MKPVLWLIDKVNPNLHPGYLNSYFHIINFIHNHGVVWFYCSGIIVGHLTWPELMAGSITNPRNVEVIESLKMNIIFHDY